MPRNRSRFCQIQISHSTSSTDDHTSRFTIRLPSKHRTDKPTAATTVAAPLPLLPGDPLLSDDPLLPDGSLLPDDPTLPELAVGLLSPVIDSPPSAVSVGVGVLFPPNPLVAAGVAVVSSPSLPIVVVIVGTTNSPGLMVGSSPSVEMTKSSEEMRAENAAADSAAADSAAESLSAASAEALASASAAAADALASAASVSASLESVFESELSKSEPEDSSELGVSSSLELSELEKSSWRGARRLKRVSLRTVMTGWAFSGMLRTFVRDLLWMWCAVTRLREDRRRTHEERCIVKCMVGFARLF